MEPKKVRISRREVEKAIKREIRIKATRVARKEIRKYESRISELVKELLPSRLDRWVREAMERSSQKYWIDGYIRGAIGREIAEQFGLRYGVKITVLKRKKPEKLI